MTEFSDDELQRILDEAQGLVGVIRGALTNCVDAASIPVKPKAPFLVLALREALAWRTDELSQNACDALRRRDLVVAALLIRAVIENGALLWKLKELLEAYDGRSIEALHQAVVQALAGWKSVPEFPQATNILTHLNRLEKAFPDVLGVYNDLSETAHPNWSGVFGAYGTFGPEEGIAHFGRDKSNMLRRACRYGTALTGALLMFSEAFDAVADLVLKLIDQLVEGGLGWDAP